VTPTPTADRPAGRVVLWLAGTCVVLGAINPERIGIGADSGVDIGWWLFHLALYAPGLVFLATSWRVRPLLLSPPLVLLTIATGWTLIVSPFGLRGLPDTFAALGLLSFLGVGAALGSHVGWSTVSRTLSWALFVFLAASVVGQLALGGDGRWQGLTAQANRLGIMAAMAVPVGVAELARRRPIGLGLILLGPTLLVLANARTSMAAAALATLVLLRPVIGRVAPVLALAGVLAALVVVISTGEVERASATVARSGEATEISSLTGRTEIWDRALDLLGPVPVTGIGAASSGEAFREAFGADFNWNPGHGHNAALQMALNGGWLAAACYVAAFVVYWRRSRAAPNSARDSLVTLLFVVGLTEDLVAIPSASWIVLVTAFAALAAAPSATPADRTAAPGRRVHAA
jgi:exopolysaccharide production protein ExoQ